MLGLALSCDCTVPLQILCLGAHSDDIEIGCGGTMLRLLAEYPEAKVHWVVFSADQARAEEARRSAECFLAKVKDREIVVKNFADGYFPYVGAEIKRFFEELKQLISPDLILTHYRHDRHQDHRVISDLAWNTFRNHLVLEYEIPKYDGDLGNPNLYVSIDESICRQKIDYLLTHFETQENKHWFDQDTFHSLLRLRGLEARSASGYAEAFYAHKLTI